MTDDPVARLKAGLDADEARANAMKHFTVYEEPWNSCAASRTEPLGDLEWGAGAPCDCFLAERKARALREVAAKRAILEFWPDPFGNWSAAQADAARAVKDHALRAIAAVYGDGTA